MEIKIIEPAQNAVMNIKFNFEELKAQLEEKLSVYKNRYYDLSKPEDKAAAKKDRAGLNKLAKALNDKKLEVKAQCLHSFTADFEPKVKTLIDMISECSAVIDEDIKTYENGQKEAKRRCLENYYIRQAEELAQIVPFDKILNEKWLNLSFNEDTAIVEIFNKIGTIRKDLQTLSEDVDSAFAVEVKDTYLSTLDLGTALRRNAELVRNAKKQAEYEAAQKVKNAKPEPDINRITGEAPVPPIPESSKILRTDEPKQQIDFRVWVTAQQKAALRDFLIKNQIKYGKVK